ncbi:uncharacterized protein LOC132698423 [Cylas formicarius]|uniref:uncharacterized protein LOC132698423 n=1 Tax=Cylas formicarius TaxID=197179 RepID=UPI0029589580|nr:uncharacterized protein LOC132698423 [Cylas formicarius]
MTVAFALVLCACARFVVSGPFDQFAASISSLTAGANSLAPDLSPSQLGEPGGKQCGTNQIFDCTSWLRKDCTNKPLWPILIKPPFCVFKTCVCAEGYVRRSFLDPTCVVPEQCS